MALDSIFIPEAVGQTAQDLFRDGRRGEETGPIRSLRNEVAHAITEEGPPRATADDAFHHRRINQWLPITKCLARLLVLHEYPNQLWGR